MRSGQQEAELIDELIECKDSFIPFFNKKWPFLLNSSNLLSKEDDAFLLRRRNKDPNKQKYALVTNQHFVGKGAGGFVYRVLATIVIDKAKRQLEINTQKQQVVKISNSTIKTDAEAVVKREYHYAKKEAKHLHVKLPIICKIEDVTFVFLLMDYIQGKDVMDCLIENIHLTTSQLLLQAALQLVNIVIELHAKNIVHCDLKPENFLYGKARGDTQNKIYLIDWAMACRAPKKKKNITGTLEYIDPLIYEIMKTSDHFFYETYCDEFSVFRALSVMLCKPTLNFDNYLNDEDIPFQRKLFMYAEYLHDNIELKDLGLKPTDHQLLEEGIKAGLHYRKEGRKLLTLFQKDLKKSVNEHEPLVSISLPALEENVQERNEKIMSVKNYLSRFFSVCSKANSHSSVSPSFGLA